MSDIQVSIIFKFKAFTISPVAEKSANNASRCCNSAIFLARLQDYSEPPSRGCDF
ncbi:hypothetical protein K0M31_002490 [Melipona bicolor]|uniref:Uncharacterized protein n=1 Tax=Melipona bicolor TaxID=60889 RepID=A0AA40GHS1_9HYME|nr:hypothetical protein K0M31_002490 [Melipona bicolor]